MVIVESWADGTSDAQMGAMTDVTHNLWMGCTDNAQTGATTDILHDLWQMMHGQVHQKA